MSATKQDRSDPRTPRARKLRSDATPAERRLWRALREILSGAAHFRRQVPIGPFYADFAEHAARLVIEVDGDSHGTASGEARDSSRTAFLEGLGYQVLRVSNRDVADNLAGVIDIIRAALPPTPDPSPPQAGGGERAASSAPLSGPPAIPAISSPSQD